VKLLLELLLELLLQLCHGAIVGGLKNHLGGEDSACGLSCC
jgi:hypothetical protein